ncbi:beta galactosidase jelly roll domain-containing protein, partial [Actinophytocola sp.]|uniref:beta galactosidase jelly roll domain-containing protein n=1 Tax=Actinophytocola sp. TaxID=1872138 RepID=UPI002D804F72
ARTDEMSTLDWSTPDGRYSVPVRVNGRDAKILMAGYDLGGQRLVWSTSELMTHAFIGGRDVALLYGRAGESGSTVLRYRSRPSVRVLDGQVRSSYDPASGDLRLDHVHSGLARVLVSGGGRRPMLLLVGTDETVATFWRLDTNAGPVLVRGTSLARSAHLTGGTLRLRADVEADGEVEVFGPAPAQRLTLGAGPVSVHHPASGSLLGRVRGPDSVRLPAFTGGRQRTEAPESTVDFADAGWTVADKTTSTSPLPPKTLPVLYAGDYGFDYGHVWYRGHFTATGAETAVTLNAITGKNGIYQVWLNGRYLGVANGGTQADTDPDNPTPNPDPGRGDFPIPAGLLTPGAPAVLSVLVENMGHNDDWIANDMRFKQPRGLTGAVVAGSSGPIAWRIQGARGGRDLADRVRGPLNNGGLFGERAGWHLPESSDRFWRPVGVPSNGALSPGISWYRTTFRLDLPRDQDVPVGLRFGGDTARNYRVLIFLNGWNVGKYINNLGPQRDFVLPAGLLDERGQNTLALAVITPEAAAGGPGPVSLVALGNQRGGVRQ